MCSVTRPHHHHHNHNHQQPPKPRTPQPQQTQQPTPVDTRNPESPANRDPRPVSPCVGKECRAWSGTNPLDWIADGGVQRAVLAFFSDSEPCVSHVDDEDPCGELAWLTAQPHRLPPGAWGGIRILSTGWDDGFLFQCCQHSRTTTASALSSFFDGR